ncbi:BACON domain-containing protein [Mucilaginibacter sp. FT3.2]|uniref:BACON domain-containing protein n=1 Tax=Mucilaginibacter sp. FT3.2 TaxID=2723090 RepID=UPI00161FEB6C|nr:BACON domain-containing protein [Mucilaginibacter sp. FT3.2]MBB6231656.1 hypothetical protein [Mucilaginibacter sp. FT3.2]
MKIKIYHASIFVLVILLFNACRKENQPVKPIPSTYFSAALQDNPAAFSNTKTITYININAGTNGWYLTQTPVNTWCVPDKNFGAGDYSLRVTINANTTGTDRTTQLVLTSTNKSLPPVTVSLTQSK